MFLCLALRYLINLSYFQFYLRKQVIPTFFNYAIANGLHNLLFPDRTGISHIRREKKPDFQLCFAFWGEAG